MKEAATGRSSSQERVGEHQEKADHTVQSRENDVKHEASMANLVKNLQGKNV